ncbi:MAG: pirin family protein [Betaproteobacteria bacterium]|nr:pirin family protein [Betaproteobacteria bacterium]
MTDAQPARSTTLTIRPLSRVIPSQATADGAGVRLRRSIGAHPGARLDPFLMLDEFSSDDAADYIAGFPAHPHRGFETVTYMLDGHMRHEDHLGNRGHLTPGSVQWMTAGRGIIHSEMPEQESGRMRGFQLWVNLPARLKMQPPWYRDIAPAELPVAALPGGGRVKVIAGELEVDGQRHTGPIAGERFADSTDPLYWDIHLPPGAVFSQRLPGGHQGFLYLYEGEASVGHPAALRALPPRAAGVLGEGDAVRIVAGSREARVLLIAGKPLREPVAQYGPFVMNTQDELRQALADLQAGRLALPAD